MIIGGYLKSNCRLLTKDSVAALLQTNLGQPVSNRDIGKALNSFVGFLCLGK